MPRQIPEELEEIIKINGLLPEQDEKPVRHVACRRRAARRQVPDTMEELVELPGVGRKTANVVLGNAFDKNEGVVVDTHVGRVSERLGLTKETDPVKIEQDLIKLFPRDQWTMLAHLFIEHGRQICERAAPNARSASQRHLPIGAGVASHSRQV